MKTDKPTLNFTNQADGVDVSIYFGYFKDEPTAALFHNDLLILIPKEVLRMGFEQGWEITSSYDYQYDNDEVPA